MDAGAYVYDEDEPEEAAEVTGQELMEIDGEIHNTDMSSVAD